MSGYVLKMRGAPPAITTRDYLCADCGRWELTIENPAPDVVDCPGCGEPAERVIGAPAVHTQFVVSATQGKSDPKPHRLALDTRPLAEGQRFNEWKQERAKLWEQDRKRRVMEALK